MSVTRQGPSGKISIAFETGSVVVPGTSLTIATSWPVKAFTSVDLPAFLGPKNAMRSLFAEGVSCISAICAILYQNPHGQGNSAATARRG